MFHTGDYVVYGNNGVCRVEGIGTLEVSGMPQDRLFYTLHPLYMKGSTLFTPVDNSKIIIRPVLSKEEAKELIREIPNLEPLWINDERKREIQYKETIRTCDCRQYVRIIKTIYLRRENRLAEGKKVTVQDEKYFHMAEEALYGELAISLELSKEEAKSYVINKVTELSGILE